MQTLQAYVDVWAANYQRLSQQIPMLDGDNPINWSDEQKWVFVRLFYHSRGHFERFLWVMASRAESDEARAIVLRNITDELGGLCPGDLSHEQLFLKFAMVFDPQIEDEMRRPRFYTLDMRRFNDGHINALMDASWDGKWAMFCAYEHLDNTDYSNLLRLAQKLGAPEDKLDFFRVHLNGDHYGQTFELLKEIWAKNPCLVRNAFTFIGEHSLTMWREMDSHIEIAGR